MTVELHAWLPLFGIAGTFLALAAALCWADAAEPPYVDDEGGNEVTL